MSTRSEKIRQRIIANEEYTTLVFRFAAQLNRAGIALTALARRLVSFVNRHLSDERSERYVLGLPELHGRIEHILREQKQAYKHHYYSYGFPYQALAILGIFGERPTEERFDSYGLSGLITRNDRVLDIGCNCGFMAIYAAFRTGCSATGIDINPYMIRIGQECAEYLRLADRVTLIPTRIQDFQTSEKSTIVFSFATHWTDDGNYRVDIRNHLLRIHELLTEKGIVVFETHCTDVGQEGFYSALEEMRTHFTWDSKVPTDKGMRELFILHKR